MNLSRKDIELLTSFGAKLGSEVINALDAIHMLEINELRDDFERLQIHCKNALITTSKRMVIHGKEWFHYVRVFDEATFSICIQTLESKRSLINMIILKLIGKNKIEDTYCIEECCLSDLY